MPGSILFLSFTAETVKERELQIQLLPFEKRLYRQPFSFVVSLIFRLTEQFEVAFLSEIEKT